jgi:hypothetical protein
MTMPKLFAKEKIGREIHKLIDFGRQLFASVLRSRRGSLSELSTLLRFQKGTKGFERKYNKLLPLMEMLKQAYKNLVLSTLPGEGLRLGIIDDTSTEKTGKNFPKQTKHYESTKKYYFSGMKTLCSSIYHKGKVATISSEIVGKGDNKLLIGKEHINVLINEYFVDIVLFDSWYAKSEIIDYLVEKKVPFVSRLRSNNVMLGEFKKSSLKKFAENIKHEQYEKIKMNNKSYWVYDTTLNLQAYGNMRIIISKRGVHDQPIFLATNTTFSSQFVDKLYMKRFSIEVFFKDAKQFLNFETFLCRNAQKWNLHLHLVNLLHYVIQTRNSISKSVRNIRENINECLLFINQNSLLNKFFDELSKRCLT